MFKNAEALEVLNQVDTLVFDKTGTLTEGKPEFEAVVSFGAYDEETLLYYAGAVEQLSEHPLAQAILKETQGRGIRLPVTKNFENKVGQGVIGSVDSKTVFVGKLNSIKDKTQLPQDIQADTSNHPFGATWVYVSINGSLEGMIKVTDKIRPSAKTVVDSLGRNGIDVVMLTGDAYHTARVVAKKLNIHTVVAEVLPSEKNHKISQLMKEGKCVAMVGDGVNDAPALAEAHVGIAMATGTDVAVESAGVTLLGGELKGILAAYHISHQTMKNIQQNLWFAFMYNALGIPIAAGILYPFLGLLMSPIFAAVAMSLSSVSVILNALRLRMTIPRKGFSR